MNEVIKARHYLVPIQMQLYNITEANGQIKVVAGTGRHQRGICDNAGSKHQIATLFSHHAFPKLCQL